MANKGTCKAEQCEKDVRAKGYCDRHYRKWRKGLLGKPRYNTCVQDGCHKPRARRGLCEEHHAKSFSKAAAEGSETQTAAAG